MFHDAVSNADIDDTDSDNDGVAKDDNMLNKYFLWWRRWQHVDGAEGQMIGGVSHCPTLERSKHTWACDQKPLERGGKLPQETRKTNQGMMGHQYFQQQWYL